jgi:hypothetical protein
MSGGEDLVASTGRFLKPSTSMMGRVYETRRCEYNEKAGRSVFKQSTVDPAGCGLVCLGTRVAVSRNKAHTGSLETQAEAHLGAAVIIRTDLSKRRRQ